MPLEIVPYTPERVDAVRKFNQRLLAGGAGKEQQFPETPAPRWMPGMELFVAVEGEAVRGGYILRRQEFSVARGTRAVAHYRLPLSEGIVNRAYAPLGMRLVRDALAREPRLYALGMGGWDQPLPRMLKRLGWRMCEAPFHLKVAHPCRFLRQIRALRTTALRRLLLDAAAFSGAGWLGLKMLGRARRGAPSGPAAKCETVPAFAGWADEVWDRSRPAYAMLAARDSQTLDGLYPARDARFLRVRAAGGWAVLLDTVMRGHKQFGDLRVGTIVDCLAPPSEAGAVIRAAARALEERGVDLIVSNQLHAAWSRALADAGFRLGPSNFLLALSPALAACAGAAPDAEFHFNRGDGDGPIHL